ncbi:hypothetical protein [Mycobacterium sp.]|uniref:hypothetical protein n=1 Tax=Mycobacterium sp. TaxID=1785 RepID=UPI0039C92590
MKNGDEGAQMETADGRAEYASAVTHDDRRDRIRCDLGEDRNELSHLWMIKLRAAQVIPLIRTG